MCDERPQQEPGDGGKEVVAGDLGRVPVLRQGHLVQPAGQLALWGKEAEGLDSLLLHSNHTSGGTPPPLQGVLEN